MVERLREKPGGPDLRVVMGDMAGAGTGRSYGLAYLVYNTIGNLLTERECLREGPLIPLLTRCGRFSGADFDHTG